MPTLLTKRFRSSYSAMFPRLTELMTTTRHPQWRVAEILTIEGFRTPGGNPINQATVSRVWSMLQAEEVLKRSTMPAVTAAPQAESEPAEEELTVSEFLDREAMRIYRQEQEEVRQMIDAVQ